MSEMQPLLGSPKPSSQRLARPASALTPSLSDDNAASSRPRSAAAAALAVDKSKLNGHRTWWSVWRAQYVALVWKCLAVLRHRALTSILVLLLPSIFIGALQGLYQSLSSVDTSPVPLGIQRCEVFNVYEQPEYGGGSCITLAYAPSNTFTDAVMTRVATSSGLRIGADVLPFTTDTDMANYFYDHLSDIQVDTAVQFADTAVHSQVTYSLWVNSTRIVTYARRGADPLWRSTGVPGRLLSVQKELDAAIIAQVAAEEYTAPWYESVSIDASRSRLRPALRTTSSSAALNELSDASVLLGAPTIDTTIAPFSDWEIFGFFSSNGPAVTMLVVAGATFIVTGVVLAAVLIMTVVTGEKSRKLVGSLRTVGLYESTYWASWFTAYVPLLLLASLIAALCGAATGISLFTNCEYGIHFLGMFLLCTSTVAMALCCASTVRMQRWVNIAAFCKFAIAVSLTTMFSAVGLYVFIYAPVLPTIIPVLVGWLPFFHYGKLMTSILTYVYFQAAPSSTTQARTVDPLAHMRSAFGHMWNVSMSVRPLAAGPSWTQLVTPLGFGFDVYVPTGSHEQQPLHTRQDVSGLGPTGNAHVFGWAQLNAQPAAIKVTVDGFDRMWQDVAPSFNLWMMLVLTIGYLLLAWYCGQVFTGDLGAAQPFYFIFSPYYWGLMKPPTKIEEGDTLALVQRLSAEEDSVRVHKLSKSYAKNTALKEVSLALPTGQCIALLGQNGAGKSTLCHCLAGLIAPTHGEAFMFGKSVRTEMSLLRDVIGICPQDDLLWDELTARQHVELFARFKVRSYERAGLVVVHVTAHRTTVQGVPAVEVREHAEARLRLVQLVNVADAYVHTFSGGMKRRLSVAMAAVGYPKIIFLDEPTTGLDPISKSRVHGMIEELKPDRVLVLTTHNMQEADALGDTVAILADGKLRAYGTPLFLKNRFGAGYQVNIISDPANTNQIKTIIEEELPGAEIVGEVANLPPGGMQPVGPAGAISLALALPGSGQVAGAGDVLRSRVASGAITVAVPRGRLAEIPRLLRRLQTLARGADSERATAASAQATAPPVREWGISGSTLEEVFLKLAAQQNTLNAGVDQTEPTAVAPMYAAPLQASMHDRAKESGPKRNVCALCLDALTDNVVLYNSQRVVVAVDGVVCAACATRTEEEIAEAKAAARAREQSTDGTAGGQRGSSRRPVENAAHALEGAAQATSSPAVNPLGPQDAADISLAARRAFPEVALEAESANRSVSVRAAGAVARGPQARKRPVRRGIAAEPVSWWAQFFAVFLLRWQLQWKQRWTNVCNICFVLVGVILTIAVTPAAVPGTGTRCLGNGGYFVDSPALCTQTGYSAAVVLALNNTPIPTPTNPRPNQQAHLTYKYQCTNVSSSSGSCLSQELVLPDFGQANTLSGTVGGGPTTLTWYADGPDSSDVPLASWDVLGAGRGVLAVPQVATFVNMGPDGVTTGTGFDAAVYGAQQRTHDRSKPMTGACASYGQYDINARIGLQFDNYSDALAYMQANFPSAAIAIRRARPFDASPTLAYDLRMWALMDMSAWEPDRSNVYQWTSAYYRNPSGFCSTLDMTPGSDAPWDDARSPMPAAALMTGLHNAFFRTMMENVGSSASNASQSYIRTAFSQWPRVQWVPGVQGSATAFQALLWPLFTLFLLPLFVYPVSFEKENKLYAMMSMAGMRQSPYMAAHYAFSFLVFVGVAAVYCVAGYLGGVPAFRNSGAALFVALLFSWGHAQAGFAIFIGSVLRNPRAATVLSYMLCVVVSVASFLIFQFAEPWPTAVTWVPFLGYTRASTLVLSYGGSFVPQGSELQAALLITAFEGTLALLIGLYLHAVLPGPDSIAAARTPWYPIDEMRGMLHGCRRATLHGEQGPTDGYVDADQVEARVGRGQASQVDEGQCEDPDVTAERERVKSGDLSNAAIVIDNLVKEYHSRDRVAGPQKARWAMSQVFDAVSCGLATPAVAMRAVNGLSLAVNYGECLGLLGPNGAGKTTTISMLTGTSTITAGVALLDGFDVATQLSHVWRVLGVCPQFDTQWDELTVAEHLYFYARLKGVSRRRLRAVVQSVAEKVNLDGDAFSQLSRGLSGGMRRRLSIAIALLGDPAPSIVTLDEPSTGLDPASRRDIWRILQSERGAGRAIILTTHAMDEADALCDRIAIMYGGKLECIGNQLRLKTKFGNGYKLTVTLRDPSQQGFSHTHLFITSALSSRARLVSRVGQTVSYILPPDDTDVASVFQLLEQQKDAAGIQDYGIAATTLEEVFVRVCHDAEAREAAHAESITYA